MLTLAKTLERGVHYGGFYLKSGDGLTVPLWAVDSCGICIEWGLASTIEGLAAEMARLTERLDACDPLSPTQPLTAPSGL